MIPVRRLRSLRQGPRTLSRWIWAVGLPLLLISAGHGPAPSLAAESVPLAPPAGGNQRNDSFEQRVLEVIRRNPAAILEALERFEQQKEQEQRDRQASLLRELFPAPARIIGASPVLGNGRDNLLVEFSDFQCPYCGQAQRTLQDLTGAEGKPFTLVFKHFPLTQIHPQALPAARAAWAAGRQGRFWEFHDALFRNQARLGEPLYGETARMLRLNREQFNRDRHSDASLRAIQQDLDLAERLGLQGTPTFLRQRGGSLEVISLPELQESARQAVKGGRQGALPLPRAQSSP